MPRHVIFSVFLVALGCSNGPPSWQSLVTHTRVLAVAPNGSTKEALQELKTSQFVGDYHVGDGLGYNLHLVLKEEGTFECTWRGCLGVYGTASGRWSIEATGLKLATRKADGMLEKKPLDELLIVAFRDHYILLQNQDRDWFDERGPNTFCCFHKKEVRKLLEDERMRRIEEASKK
jgi:hypothetical protein